MNDLGLKFIIKLTMAGLVIGLFSGCHQSEADLAKQRERYQARNSQQIILRFLTRNRSQAPVELRSHEQAVNVRFGEKVDGTFELINLSTQPQWIGLKFDVTPLNLEKNLVVLAVNGKSEETVHQLKPLEKRQLLVKFQLRDLNAGHARGNDYIKLTVDAINRQKAKVSTLESSDALVPQKL